MLIAAGIMSFVLYAIPAEKDPVNLVLGGVLIAVCILNSIIEFDQEQKSASLLESFKNLIPAQSLVMRNGVQVEVPASELVCGDLVVLKNGQKVPADCRLVACTELKVDNSSLTGESEPIELSLSRGIENPLEASNLAFYGSLIVNGDGYGIVVRTGDKTVLGSIASLASSEVKRESQLTKEIDYFVKVMASIACFFGLAFFLAFVIKDATTGDRKIDWNNNLNFAIGILVAFVPQGLPLTVTVLLTIAAKKLAGLKVLVKDLTGVETLGSITLLASDKTGTLTQNKMTVVGAWVNLEAHNIQDDDERGQVTGLANLEELQMISCMCSKAKFDEADKNLPIEERRVFGDATETGLLRYAAAHLNIDELHSKHPKVFEIPFSSHTKWNMTIHKMKHENGSLKMLIKGAPERVFKMCSHVKVGDETLVMTEEHVKLFNEAYEHFASQGQRVLAFGVHYLNSEFPEDFKFVRDPANFPMDQFVFMGMIALIDPPKRGVRKAVASCRSAGIQVVMVTGDHPLTAEAIARKIGLIQGETAHQIALRMKKPVQMVKEEEYDAIVIHGDKIDNMSNEEWDRILSKKEIVFARTAPHHKLMIVKKCQDKGHIVGVSGDGVNDSPALKKADLGISMNNTGSDVSKEAAAMILLDDNFASIVTGIAQGRMIFSNLKKSIRYTLTHIIPEAMAFFVFIIFNIPLPLNSILILLIDLGTELVPALSYAYEAGDSDLMLMPPRKVLCTEGKSNARFDSERGGVAGEDRAKTAVEKVIRAIKKPFARNETGEVLVDSDLLIWSYLEGGVIVTIACFVAYFLSLSLDSINLSNLIGNKVSGEKLLRAQAAYFLGVVIGQWFTLFVCKRQYDYPIGMKLLANKRSIAGVVVGAVIACIVVYVPELNKVLQAAPVRIEPIAAAFGVAFLMVPYEFVRKYLRKQGYFGGVPKKNVNLLELVRTTSTC
jgi:sodium/potassium-transporting ATPase subunit alpha